MSIFVLPFKCDHCVASIAATASAGQSPLTPTKAGLQGRPATSAHPRESGGPVLTQPNARQRRNPAFAGMSGGCCSSVRHSTPIYFSNSPRSQRSAARIFDQAPGSACILESPHRPEKEPRARGTPGVQRDPRGLDASRHRGLSKSCVPHLSLWFERSAKRAASPPNLRRPARGV